MKSKILYTVLFALFATVARAQFPVQRSPSTVQVMDARAKFNLNLVMPVFPDTATANVYKGLDSLGAIIQIADGTVWHRTISTGTIKRWLAFPSPTGSAAWGTITGTLSAQTDLNTALAGKQNVITAGTSAQYFRGDFSLATFPTNVSSFTNDAGYITSVAVNSQYSITGNGTTGSKLQLVNDASTPGASKFYGTDGSGTRGWFTLPAGTGTVTSVTANAPLTGGTITTTGSIGIDTSAGKIATKTDLLAYVKSVAGTTNRITSTGGQNPAIDISSTFEGTLGKIANRIDQNNAATTSAQLASVISDELGTGRALFAPAPAHDGMKLSSLSGVPVWQDTTVATGYTLPTASTSTLGGVKVDGTTITISGGVISAVGGGSGSANTFVGTGFRLGFPGTNIIKTLVGTAFAGIKIDSSSTTLNLSIDSSQVATRTWVNSLTTTFILRTPGTIAGGVPLAYTNSGALVIPLVGPGLGISLSVASDSALKISVDTSQNVASKDYVNARMSGGGGGTPAGSTNDVQINNGGVFGNAGLTANPSTGQVVLTKNQNNPTSIFASNSGTGANAAAEVGANNSANTIKLVQKSAGGSPYGIIDSLGSSLYSNAPAGLSIFSEARIKIGAGAGQTNPQITITPTKIKISPAFLQTGTTGDSLLVYHAADSSAYLVAQSSIGGGTITAVNGTTNRITSSGGTTPAIDISSTFEATLGKVANPLSQFASTTSAQLMGVLSDEIGTGKALFIAAPAHDGMKLTSSSGVAVWVDSTAGGSGFTPTSTGATITISGSNLETNHPNLRPTSTVSSPTTFSLAAGDMIDYIWVDPTSSTTSFQVGTTTGTGTGSDYDVVPTQNLTGGGKYSFLVGYRATGTTTLYFQNISSSTVITLIKRQ